MALFFIHYPYQETVYARIFIQSRRREISATGKGILTGHIPFNGHGEIQVFTCSGKMLVKKVVVGPETFRVTQRLPKGVYSIVVKSSFHNRRLVPGRPHTQNIWLNPVGDTEFARVGRNCVLCVLFRSPHRCLRHRDESFPR